MTLWLRALASASLRAPHHPAHRLPPPSMFCPSSLMLPSGRRAPLLQAPAPALPPSMRRAAAVPRGRGYSARVTFAGLRVCDVEAVARGVLPRHYTVGVRADSWAVFRGCAARRVVVTASPVVMVGEFVREFLGAEVAGTELETCAGGTRFTGRIKAALVGERKREVVQRLFAGGDMPDVGLGDRESDHDFMAICKVVEGRGIRPTANHPSF
ncbi:hypothetical protein C2845_PM11G12250 [Panicum miliaceum]|uniref:Glycerol-3-phosphate acyltransferase RAM2/GPAT1-8 HAD-like domain-containing protein n=1 Tax=Panicum miliaceum TaxID=4540 RepID=A0A3L6RN90_PANMI|nr:hypothetical protein C2845_PM11G12250 [Panicum miliaceum]